MREKLELKIVIMVFLMLIVGVAVAVSMSFRIEREDMYSVSRERLADTARLVSKSIERSMVEADSDFTKILMDELKTISGFELNVFNSQRREAFVFMPDAEPVDDKVLESVISSGKETVSMDGMLLNFYIPLNNRPECQECHFGEANVIGTIRLSISLEKEYNKIVRFGVIMGIGGIVAVVLIGTILWLALRKSVVTPLKSLEGAAQRMARPYVP